MREFEAAFNRQDVAALVACFTLGGTLVIETPTTAAAEWTVGYVVIARVLNRRI